MRRREPVPSPALLDQNGARSSDRVGPFLRCRDPPAASMVLKRLKCNKHANFEVRATYNKK